MAGQQQQIIDTIFNLKRRLLRSDDSSDAEETDTPYNKRMHSLKRKAQYARSSRPETASDPPPYKKRIEHAGYHRYILQRNPPRYDPDGDIVEPGDEYEDEDDLSPVEENPYADIKLEELLAPLTAPADLATHPSYSIAYTSKHLTNLTNEAGAISRKEQVLLAQAKTLFTKLIGDPFFVPDNVPDLHYGENLADPWVDLITEKKAQSTNGNAQQGTNHEAAENAEHKDTWSNADVAMEDAEQHQEPQQQQQNGVHPNPAETNEPKETVEAANGPAPEPLTNGDTHKEEDTTMQDDHHADQNGSRHPSPGGDDASSTASHQTSHRMTTRARANAASDPSPPTSPSNEPPVHPLFTYLTATLPDRDFGLPSAEAEDTRMLLLAFVQKQEEIARAGENLYLGMLQAERMRKDVYSWSKADGHVGEMSDGEDWYDIEEWGLTEDLVKGRDEEEDDTQVQGKKSTRQRRGKDKEDR